VRDRLAGLEAAAAARRAAGAPADIGRQVGNPNGGTRLFDPLTGFQGGHVSDYRDGDWRRLLPADALRVIDVELGRWLARHGYPPTLAPVAA
jgi:hypothetical protein